MREHRHGDLVDVYPNAMCHGGNSIFGDSCERRGPHSVVDCSLFRSHMQLAMSISLVAIQW